MEFVIEASDINSHARAGTIITDHGPIQTPIFMPVGTVGTVKGVHTYDLDAEIKAEIILGNTYHLYLRPGMDTLEKAGGLHLFNGWKSPILTDSGGYQVYSLSGQRKITEEGVVFRSHIDGSKHQFTPEGVMDIQRSIGADIIMAFDECPPYPSEYGYAKKSMDLTHRWLKRCINHFNASQPKYAHRQFLFPIVQGSSYGDLRKASAEFIAEQGAVGNAIGGLSVGEPAEMMYDITEQVCAILPSDKPRYLMGVGTPVNILEGISRGIDMFDCVMPTRNARHGYLFTQEGIINIKNAKWKDDFSPLDENSTSKASTFYSKSYVRHLFQSGELLGPMITSLHNLNFYLWLVKEAREKIKQGGFLEWKNRMVKVLDQRL